MIALTETRLQFGWLDQILETKCGVLLDRELHKLDAHDRFDIQALAAAVRDEQAHRETFFQGLVILLEQQQRVAEPRKRDRRLKFVASVKDNVCAFL